MELAESYPAYFAGKGGLTRVVDLLKTYELEVSPNTFPSGVNSVSCMFLVLKKTTGKEDQVFQVKGDGCKASNCTGSNSRSLLNLIILWLRTSIIYLRQNVMQLLRTKYFILYGCFPLIL